MKIVISTSTYLLLAASAAVWGPTPVLAQNKQGLRATASARELETGNSCGSRCWGASTGDCIGYDTVCHPKIPNSDASQQFCPPNTEPCVSGPPPTCMNSAPYGGQDEGCTKESPICVGVDGKEIAADTGGASCAPCINSFDSGMAQADFGCEAWRAPGDPRCVLDDGAIPDVWGAGTQCAGLPSASPSVAPSVTPSAAPSFRPSELPSEIPSVTPSQFPSVLPSEVPSQFPSVLPSELPSELPSAKPSQFPSELPSNFPSQFPSQLPSGLPSEVPSAKPSQFPSELPSVTPSQFPSVLPSEVPSQFPSVLPSELPSELPSAKPSQFPSELPSNFPSQFPSQLPSGLPSELPSQLPSQLPSELPSELPSLSPSAAPTRMQEHESTVLSIDNMNTPRTLEFPFYNLPTVASGTPVTIKTFVRGDLDANTEYYSVFGESIVSLGDNQGRANTCTTKYKKVEFTVPAATFSTWAADGQVDIRLVATNLVSRNCAFNDAYVEIAYVDSNGSAYSQESDVGGLRQGLILDFDFPNLPPSISDVTIQTFVRGDLGATNEFYLATGENQYALGKNRGGSNQCSSDYNKKEFTVPKATFNEWAQDAQVDIRLIANKRVGDSCTFNDAYVVILYKSD